jgi:hypothetical protein
MGFSVDTIDLAGRRRGAGALLTRSPGRNGGIVARP